MIYTALSPTKWNKRLVLILKNKSYHSATGISLRWFPKLLHSSFSAFSLVYSSKSSAKEPGFPLPCGRSCFMTRSCFFLFPFWTRSQCTSFSGKELRSNEIRSDRLLEEFPTGDLLEEKNCCLFWLQPLLSTIFREWHCHAKHRHKGKTRMDWQVVWIC